MDNRIRLCCPCHFGLESVLKFEITKIGGEDLVVSDGKITFSGDENIIARANLSLSTAERVLIELAEFKAVTFEELFQGVKAIELERFIGRDDAFPVKGYSLNSKLHSVPDCQSIIKKAAVERLKSKYGVSWFDESAATVQIKFSILKDMVSIYLDTSGVGLHKRGYRRVSNAAPIKETLAAGIVDLARVRQDSVVCDPFCGSGTIPIEAAMMGQKIAPGVLRNFRAESFRERIPEKLWKNAREEARSLERRERKFQIQGFDIDRDMIRTARQNAEMAGVADRIHFQAKPVKELASPKKYGFIITNPPYGERLEEKEALPALYREIGDAYRRLDSWSCFLITSYEEAQRDFGRQADKNRKIYNGMLKTYFYQFLGPKPPRDNEMKKISRKDTTGEDNE